MKKTQLRKFEFSLGRVYGLVLRYWYLLKGSIPRLLELAYWPSIQLVLWGFISQFFLTQSSALAGAAGVLIGAVLLWDILFRGQLGFSISFLEELWSRNLGHLFVTPLRAHEFIAALMTISLIRVLIGVGPAILIAIPLYHFSIFDLGLPLIAFFVNLMMFGWAIGLMVTALLLRVGVGGESIAWAMIFLIAPVSAIYYPVVILPDWLQIVAWALPPAHIFEGMRAVLIEGTFDFGFWLNALGLNMLYLTIGGATFLYNFRAARRDGRLLQIGE
jgi:ABC-2 type transport system permease protein